MLWGPAGGGGSGGKLVGSLYLPWGLLMRLVWALFRGDRLVGVVVQVGGKNIILRVEGRVDLTGYCCTLLYMGSCSGLDQAWRAGREGVYARLSFRGRRVIARASCSSQQAQLQGVRMDRKMGAQSVEGCRWWLVI
eukprot:scaffold17249_cov126-Isochrysis_galbana.AAC.2